MSATSKSVPSRSNPTPTLHSTSPQPPSISAATDTLFGATSARLHLEAPAKINAYLAIEGKRPDGFHQLVTLMLPLELVDQVTIEVGFLETPQCNDVSLNQHPLLSDTKDPPSSPRKEKEGDVILRELPSSGTASSPTHDLIESIHFCCDDSALPSPLPRVISESGSKKSQGSPRNLVLQAAELFAQQLKKQLITENLPQQTPPVSARRTRVTLHLQKKIPHGAGLGGGSSDAAAVLHGLNQLYGFPFKPNALQKMAAQLGSDVPFFLEKKATWCHGRGEKLLPLSAEEMRHLQEQWGPSLTCLLIKPPFGVATPSAYQAYQAYHRDLTNQSDQVEQPYPPPRAHQAHQADRNQQEHPIATKATATRAERTDTISEAPSFSPPSLPDWQEPIRNDLEAPVFEKFRLLPLLKRWLQAQPGVEQAWMSGSGSTIVALLGKKVDHDREIARLQKHLQQKFGKSFWSYGPTKILLGSTPPDQLASSTSFTS